MDALVVFCGRVLSIHTQEKDLTIDDGSAARRFSLTEHSGILSILSPGDWVALVLHSSQRFVEKVKLLERCRLSVEGKDFPPIEGEWYRLQKNYRKRFSNLSQRGFVLKKIRQFFADRDFLEIEAPIMVPSPGLELHLQAMKIEGHERYLITSPEYQLKRLLCGGFQRIYSLGKVFRSGELGSHHNPEFTMLEWYRAFDSWESVAQDVAELFAHLTMELTGTTQTVYQGLCIDFKTPWPRATIAEVVERYTQIRLYGDESIPQLAQKIQAKGFRLPSPPWHWDDLFFSMFMDHVEPYLGQPNPGESVARPLVLYDWPKSLCALARINPENQAVVERFEAYAGGLELCNGFGELTDPMEQQQRFFHDLQERKKRSLPEYPIDERFLGALWEGMPPSGGVALGVDRLMMLLLNAAQIADVLPFTAAEL